MFTPLGYPGVHGVQAAEKHPGHKGGSHTEGLRHEVRVFSNQHRHRNLQQVFSADICQTLSF